MHLGGSGCPPWDAAYHGAMPTKKIVVILAIVFLAAIGLKVILSRRSGQSSMELAPSDDDVQVINT